MKINKHGKAKIPSQQEIHLLSNYGLNNDRLQLTRPIILCQPNYAVNPLAQQSS